MIYIPEPAHEQSFSKDENLLQEVKINLARHQSNEACEIYDRRNLHFLKRWWIDIDKINFLVMIGIMIFGLMITASSSPAVAKKIDVAKFFFLKKQIIFAAVSLLLITAISLFDEEQIKKFAIIGMACVLIMLVLVLFFGSSAKGATRWISIAGFTLQPSEFAKALFIICNSLILQKFHRSKISVKYGFSAALFLVLVALLICQPDFGMSLTITALWISHLFLNGLPWLFIGLLGFFAALCAVLAYITLPHVEDRINRFLDTGQHNYQAERSIDAFMNGSFFGTGPGNGVVKKFIPDVHTDFIFAAIAEEYGILCCCALILAFAYLATRIVKRALDEEDMFVYLSLCGLMLQFTMQVLVNIGVSLRLLPTKGMTLPFISYGGSSMMSTAICFGLILAFTKRKYHRNVDYGNLKML